MGGSGRSRRLGMGPAGPGICPPPPPPWGGGCWANAVVTRGRVTRVELDAPLSARVELSLRSDIDDPSARGGCNRGLHYREYDVSLTSTATGETIHDQLAGEAHGDRIPFPGRKGATFPLRWAHAPGSYRLRFAVRALDSDDRLIFDRAVHLAPGLNRFAFDLSVTPPR